MIKADYWNFPHTMLGVTILLEVATQHGLGIEQCLQGTTIQLAQIGDLHAYIDPEQEFQVTRNVLKLIPAEIPFSIEVGQRIQLVRFGIWGLAILNSKTFLEAVLTGLRFVRLSTSYCHISPVLQDQEAYLKLDNANLPEDLQQFFVEREAIMLINIQLALNAQSLAPTALRFQHPAPAYADQFEKLLGIAAQFEQHEHAVAINAQALYCPIPASNPDILASCAKQCQQLLSQHDQVTGFRGKVQRYLSENLLLMPSLESTAQHLNLHPRTLKRYLQDENSSFSTLLMEIKGTLALEFLTKTDLSLEKIAEQLGYAELSSFSRAFKNWKGTSPKKIRMLGAEYQSPD